MGLSARLLLGAIVLATQGCVSSSVILQVHADGRGRATVTSRVFMSGIKAFDSLFPPPAPAETPRPEALLPEPLPGDVDRAFGTSVRVASSTFESAQDGGIRTTTVEFDDIKKVRLAFPLEFSLPGTTFYGISGIDDGGAITFAVKPHENGDEMLIVKMPDPAVTASDTNEPITKFETDSPEERTFKRAIKNMRIALRVELEEPLLRTNAPKMSDNGATILDLDMDRMINPMDEPRQTQAPPDTEIYLMPMKVADGTITIGAPADITNNPGYDNQPFFTADGRSILFTSIRNGGTQTDIYRYDITTAQIAQVTNTPESEYSPTITPSGTLAVVRAELDGQSTQRLWQFSADGRDPRVVLADVKPVGYHAWADDHTVALFILGANGAASTLRLADARTGAS